MPYRYIPDVAIADVAFEVWAGTMEELFMDAADAALNVMVSDLRTVAPKIVRAVHLEDA